LRKFKRKFQIGISDYSRFKSTRSAIRKSKNNNSKLFGPSKSGILTLNVRNKDFIKKYNKRHDLIYLTKLETKARLLPADIPMPLTYLVVSNETELEGFYDFLAYNQGRSFVIKPNRGHVGKGILIIKRIVGKRFISVTGRALDLNQVTNHIRLILKGKFSTPRTDAALVEELNQPHKMLRNLYSNGLLDIRIICFQGYPVMAMMRLPTTRSAGKANLHRGAIGAGLKLGTGEIFHAIYKRKEVDRHPNTKYKFIGFKLPNWPEVLSMAVRAQVLSGLGFVGIDLCIDQNHGLMIMEVNKRPGLEIQIANQAGLLSRLRKVEREISETNGNLSTSDKINQAIFWDNNGWEN
jgi:alpha-L-glutamate ligase-like protein